MVKTPDKDIILAYKKFKSVWKAGKFLGLCGQTVHERLVKLGVERTHKRFSKQEDLLLLKIYKKYSSEGKLNDLSVRMGRTKQFICRRAGRLGLTDLKHKRPYIVEVLSIRMKEWHRTNEHMRGSLGMKHTAESLKKMSDASKARWKTMSEEERDMRSKIMSINALKYLKNRGRTGASWKCGWRKIGRVRKYFRSRWEANYGFYLEWLRKNKKIKKWEHEPKVFWFKEIKRGCLSYLPDFRVTMLDGSIEYHEVKGWMDARSITKIKRMAKYFPKVTLVVIDSKEYRKLKLQVCRIVPGWED